MTSNPLLTAASRAGLAQAHFEREHADAIRWRRFAWIGFIPTVVFGLLRLETNGGADFVVGLVTFAVFFVLSETSFRRACYYATETILATAKETGIEALYGEDVADYVAALVGADLHRTSVLREVKAAAATLAPRIGVSIEWPTARERRRGPGVPPE